MQVLKKFASKRTSLLVFIVAMIVYSTVISINIYKYEQFIAENPDEPFLHLFSGDEPHFLSVTSAIIYHQSIFVDDHFLSQLSDAPADPYMNWPQVPYSEPRYWGSDQLENGHYISRHGPGISFLLVPSYAIGGLYGVLYTMAIFSSLISVLIYKFTSKLTTKKIGLITTIVFSFFTILISHSYKVLSDYPIVLLALASLYFKIGRAHV